MYPVKLRVIFERKSWYFATGKDLSEEDFKRAWTKPREEFKEVRNYLKRFQDQAQKAIDSTMPFFSVEKFEKAFFPEDAQPIALSLENIYDEQIRENIEEGRIGNADSFRYSKASIFKFRPGAQVSDITPEFLRAYEKWMLEQGRSLATIGMHLRALRVVINLSGGLSEEQYPFGKKPKYEIPAGKNTKKALNREELQRLFMHQPEKQTEARALDFWKFIYLCNGMNPKDVAELKFKNYDRAKQKLEFIRAKTKRTSRNPESIKILMSPEAVEILERYANKRESPDTFIFPILNPDDSPQKQEVDINNFTNSINAPMRNIAESLGIAERITTYVARHSMATMLKHGRATMEEISESLGHKDFKTTKRYLDSFDDNTGRKLSNMLTNFDEPE
jgi:integrase